MSVNTAGTLGLVASHCAYYIALCESFTEKNGWED